MLMVISAQLTVVNHTDQPLNTPQPKKTYCAPSLTILALEFHTQSAIGNLQESDVGGGAAS